MKYIDANKLKAEIERRFSEYNHDSSHHIQAAECASILDFIDTLNTIDSIQQEQPESDIEKEIHEYIEKEFGERWDGCVPISCFDLVMMANYFYELGLNVRKEE